MVYGHYAHELQKVSIELPRFAVLASVHRTANVGSFDPRKKVRIELQTVAFLWALFKTAKYGRCAQVISVFNQFTSFTEIKALFFLKCPLTFSKKTSKITSFKNTVFFRWDKIIKEKLSYTIIHCRALQNYLSYQPYWSLRLAIVSLNCYSLNDWLVDLFIYFDYSATSLGRWVGLWMGVWIKEKLNPGLSLSLSWCWMLRYAILEGHGLSILPRVLDFILLGETKNTNYVDGVIFRNTNFYASA